jgi:hypothetical protein
MSALGWKNTFANILSLFFTPMGTIALTLYYEAHCYSAVLAYRKIGLRIKFVAT